MKVINFNLIVLILIASACVNVSEVLPEKPNDKESLEQAVIAQDFKFRTTNHLNLTISTLDNQNLPLNGIHCAVNYTLDSVLYEIGKGVTGEEGMLSLSLAIPSFVDTIEVNTNYIGLPTVSKLDVMEGEFILTVGGSNAFNAKKVASHRANAKMNLSEFATLSSYDSYGVPDNLIPIRDIISQDLLDMINTTLPERYPVPIYNPEYLREDIVTDAQLVQSAEVWVTFVHEGAGWRNALGYYTYELDNPPRSFDDVDEFNIIFPNVSFPRSGGNLKSGSKVSLGTFPANTGIGWFLIPDAWNGSEIITKDQIKYSNKDFNTFTDQEFRQHTVLLKDENRQLLLLGMEDTSRPSGDNDFNDAVFYITANPFEALGTDQLEQTKTEGKDTDADGVSDINDAYPTDPSKSFDIFSPSKNNFGGLAFEDNWPQKGDYDLNDLVMEYNYQMITNTSNKVAELVGRFKLVAAGAEFSNGFGIRIPVKSNLVEAATISQGGESRLIEFEGDQNDVVFILFEDAHDILGTSGPVNTIPERDKVDAVEFELRVNFKNPVPIANIGYAPYDPFIIVDGDRGREVHLPDHPPTSRADQSWLGSSHDTSDRSRGRYYKSQSNLPWAIHVPASFQYPKEYAAINAAHKKFVQWAESGGQSFKDWYLNKNNYRDEINLYK